MTDDKAAINLFAKPSFPLLVPISLFDEEEQREIAARSENDRMIAAYRKVAEENRAFLRGEGPAPAWTGGCRCAFCRSFARTSANG